MKIKCIAVGAKPDKNTAGLVNKYQDRLNKKIDIHWLYIKNSEKNGKQKSIDESSKILKLTSQSDFIILLDKKGTELSSERFSELLYNIPSSKNITFIIGGSYGVNNEVLERADYIWSLGKATYPHQLIKIMLTEQLYRAYCIKNAHPYHH